MKPSLWKQTSLVLSFGHPSWCLPTSTFWCVPGLRWADLTTFVWLLVAAAADRGAGLQLCSVPPCLLGQHINLGHVVAFHLHLPSCTFHFLKRSRRKRFFFFFLFNTATFFCTDQMRYSPPQSAADPGCIPKILLARDCKLAQVSPISLWLCHHMVWPALAGYLPWFFNRNSGSSQAYFNLIIYCWHSELLLACSSSVNRCLVCWRWQI